MSEEAKKPNQRPDKKQISEWKKEHGDLFQVTLETGEIAILRKPKLRDLEVMAKASKNSPLAGVKTIVNNCKLYVDSGVIENDSNYSALLSKVDDIIEIKEAEVKKL